MQVTPKSSGPGRTWPNCAVTTSSGSMGQVGAAGDNAAMESFALLQNNVLNRRRWTTRQHLRIAIITWIQRTYHGRSASAG